MTEADYFKHITYAIKLLSDAQTQLDILGYIEQRDYLIDLITQLRKEHPSIKA